MSPAAQTGARASAGRGVLHDRDRMAESVFGRTASHAGRPWWDAALASALFLAGAVVAMLRVPVSTWNLLWAEDGSIFVTDAYARGMFANLFDPYAGYAHLLPRIASQAIVTVVPADRVALAITVAASVVWAATAASVYLFSRDLVRSRVIRVGFWLMLMLVPVGSLEVAGTIANSHWFLIVGGFWALLVRDRGIPTSILAGVVIALAALSDPLVLALAPIVVLRFALLRRRSDLVVSIVYVAAMAVQLLCVLTTSRDTSDEHPGAGDLFRSFLVRVLVGGFLNRSIVDRLRERIGDDGILLIGVALFVVLTVIAVVCLRRSAVPLIALVFAVAFSAITTWLTWSAISAVPPELVIIGGSRYAIPSILVAYAVPVIALDLLVRRWSGVRARVSAFAAGALLVLVALSWTPDFVVPYRPVLPDAPTQFHAAGCDADGFARIAIMPGGRWTAVIPCSAFASD